MPGVCAGIALGLRVNTCRSCQRSVCPGLQAGRQIVKHVEQIRSVSISTHVKCRSQTLHATQCAAGYTRFMVSHKFDNLEP
ncbi:uncharacterized protein PHACADRAFT_253283 [Phanerochaete carnosa HHB-10118-sp]|uniref:Uncharacterized protein n=1 Tax=Phanerochaete carnosa (strain HHB-10118-sp) TaxID=650164 RepID=K5VXF2_PHACS|nr:uncharacterized protein PHACADRAFT_253283 [Phanerochaete carnosa HHB-10118-sp]EKM56253.1 hypothetical protein PHACADRAFT_253283 [Phanerochaete carnosa HHB-10118-sp]